MDFVIDRSTWRCGCLGANKRGIGLTALLNSHGFMCCLGQWSRQLGAHRKQILNKSNPSDLKFPINLLSEYDYIAERMRDTDFSYDAISINDMESLSIEEREQELTKVCNKYGHTLKFVGEYAQ